MKKLWVLKIEILQTLSNLSETFSYAENFNQDLSNWKTTNVTDMSVTFFNAKKFNSPLNNWDTYNVEKYAINVSMAHAEFNQELIKCEK
nr:BspA family leucine-rich repeat surface protein [Mycoplasmopsis bovis]